MEEWDTSEKVECDLTVTPMDRARRRIALNLAEDQLAGRKPLPGLGIASRRAVRKLETEVRDTAIAKVVEAMLDWKRESDPKASLEDVVSEAVDYFEKYHETVFNEKTIWRAWRQFREVDLSPYPVDQIGCRHVCSEGR
jgi:hypothetical protein